MQIGGRRDLEGCAPRKMDVRDLGKRKHGEISMIRSIKLRSFVSLEIMAYWMSYGELYARLDVAQEWCVC